MRTTSSRSLTKIFPSPILPVRAALMMASSAWSSSSLLTAISSLTFGRKSTTYSAPRYSSVWPRWRPKPLTSVTVMPWTPISPIASRTSSSLKGLMIAVMSFTTVPLCWRPRQRFRGFAFVLRLAAAARRWHDAPGVGKP